MINCLVTLLFQVGTSVAYIPTYSRCEIEEVEPTTYVLDCNYTVNVLKLDRRLNSDFHRVDPSSCNIDYGFQLNPPLINTMLFDEPNIGEKKHEYKSKNSVESNKRSRRSISNIITID